MLRLRFNEPIEMTHIDGLLPYLCRDEMFIMILTELAFYAANGNCIVSGDGICIFYGKTAQAVAPYISVS